MRTSTLNKKSFLIKIKAIIFWVIIWQLISIYLSNKLLLPSPITVILALFELMQTRGFYLVVLNSFIKIISGFFIGSILGVLLAGLSYNSKTLRYLLEPLLSIIKSTPVASIIIVALVWISSVHLSIFIAFLMVLPTIYTNMLKALDNVDKKMLEMAYIFRVTKFKKIKYIYIPEVKPYLVAATSVALGFCWKAGIAAEVIGLPNNTMGEALYTAKIYLNIPELFAWTISIVLISVVFEKIFISLLMKI